MALVLGLVGIVLLALLIGAFALAASAYHITKGHVEDCDKILNTIKQRLQQLENGQLIYAPSPYYMIKRPHFTLKEAVEALMRKYKVRLTRTQQINSRVEVEEVTHALEK